MHWSLVLLPSNEGFSGAWTSLHISRASTVWKPISQRRMGLGGHLQSWSTTMLHGPSAHPHLASWQMAACQQIGMCLLPRTAASAVWVKQIRGICPATPGCPWAIMTTQSRPAQGSGETGRRHDGRPRHGSMAGAAKAVGGGGVVGA
ncbi:hypothetical protein ACCO45_001842 [Purpureocillium lilacinum]|uniref:Uncharacterized protein n=1 Tax=Purpureocillium lilacinum TaxID=33203 RepID=A0ACC4EB84_PURLI